MGVHFFYEKEGEYEYKGWKIISSRLQEGPTFPFSTQDLAFLHAPMMSDIVIPEKYLEGSCFEARMAATCHFLRDALKLADREPRYEGVIGIDLADFAEYENLNKSIRIISDAAEEYLNDKKSELEINLIVSKNIFNCLIGGRSVREEIGSRFDPNEIARALYEDNESSADNEELRQYNRRTQRPDALPQEAMFARVSCNAPQKLREDYDSRKNLLGEFLKEKVREKKAEGIIRDNNDFFDRAKISEPAYRKIVNGTTQTPNTDTLEKIVEALKLNNAEANKLWKYSGRVRGCLEEDFPDMLMALMDEHGISINDMGKETNLDRRNVAAYMKGKRNPEKIMLMRMAIYMELDRDKVEKFWNSAGYVLTKTDAADLVMEYCLGKKYDDIEVSKALTWLEKG